MNPRRISLVASFIMTCFYGVTCVSCQYQRCRRAAMENIKPHFFSRSSTSYGAVEVADVYKVENKALLEEFQTAALDASSGKVGI